MYRLIIISILICFTVSLSGQVSNPKFEYKTSYVSTVIAFDVVFNGTLSTEKANYWSLLNSGPYVPINTVFLQHGKTIVRLNTLSLHPGINNLILKYIEGDKEINFSHKIDFINPVLTVNSVMQGSLQIKKDSVYYVINKNEEVTFSYTAEFPPINDPDPYTVPGSQNLTGIKYKFNNEDWYNSGINGELKLKNFHEGENQLLVTYQSEVSAEYPITKVDIIKFFYIDFELPQGLINNEFLQVDKIYKLKGIPDGGYFTGFGIVSSTGLYNPAEVDGETDEVIYHYIQNGDTISISKTINLKPIDNIKIAGNQQVCANHQQLKYSVEGVSKYSVKYDWSIYQNGKEVKNNDNIFTVSNDGSYIRVNWIEGISNGKITVDVVVNNGIDFYIKDSILVDVNPEKVPDKSYAFFLDKEAKFLACSDTSANFYFWYKNKILIKETSKPYLIINNFIPTVQDSFYVETSYNGECKQKSYECTKGDVGILAYGGNMWPIKQNENIKLINPDIMFFPNPANSVITIHSPKVLQNITTKIYNLEGKVLLTDNFLNFIGSKEIEINVLENGQYILELILENGQRITSKFVVLKN